MPYMPGAPVLGPDQQRLIQDALRQLSDHAREVERARAAGLDVGDQPERNRQARSKLQAIHDTYFDPTAGLQ